jgi:hypothetical protein
VFGLRAGGRPAAWLLSCRVPPPCCRSPFSPCCSGSWASSEVLAVFLVAWPVSLGGLPGSWFRLPGLAWRPRRYLDPGSRQHRRGRRRCPPGADLSFLPFYFTSGIPGLLPLRAARCACWMRPGGAPLPLPVCPLLGLLCFGCAAVPVAGALAAPASLRVSEFRQLLLGAQRARAGGSVTLDFAQLRGA